MLRTLRSIALALALALGILTACPCQCGSGGAASANPGESEPAPKARTATFAVKQVSCHGCAEKITKQLATIAGVDQVAVDLKAARVKVAFDAGKTDAETIRTAIEKLGFPARLVEETPAH